MSGRVGRELSGLQSFSPDDAVVEAVVQAVLGGAFEGDEVWHRALEANSHVHGAKGCLEGCEDVRSGRVGVGWVQWCNVLLGGC